MIEENNRIFNRDDDLPDWADSAPDWRAFTRDELDHRRFADENQ
jgi:hypothetical protein